jgi:hypothetical protein
MKNILANWNFMRALRLVLGVIIIVQGIQATEWMYAIAGILLSGMAIANIGCCGVGGCNVPFKKVNPTISNQEINYEEIH